MVAVADKSITAPEPFRRSWAPRERLSVSSWSDRYRNLQRGYSAEPGPYRTARTPYLAGVMDAFSDPSIDVIIFVKSARVGGTEAVNNMLAYAIDQEPGPLLYVYPTQSDAEEECVERIAKFIENSPRLARHIPSRSWSTKTHLELDTMDIHMAWAAAPGTLIRRTCRYTFWDELDNCEQQASKFGDVLALGMERVTTFKDRAKTVVVSTPTTGEAAASRAFEKSDKRSYHVPCPKCGAYQTLVFAQLKIEGNERDPDAIQNDDLAYYECVECQAKLKDGEHKEWMTERGVWLSDSQRIVQRLPVRGKRAVERSVFNHPKRWMPAIEGDALRSRWVGFHVWSAYSPWRTWSQIMAKWFSVQGDPFAMRVFINSWLGEAWEDVKESVSPATLREDAADGLPEYSVPEGVMKLVAGIDVQAGKGGEPGHVYWCLRGWGYECESWLVAHGICWAEPENNEDEIDALEKAYAFLYGEPFKFAEGGQDITPELVIVDSGYRAKAIYEFCAGHHLIVPGKGFDRQMSWGRFAKANRQTPLIQGTAATWRPWLVNVDTYACKEALYRWASRSGRGPGTFHLHHMALDDDAYIKQFTSEHLVEDKGKPVWKTKTLGRANHYLDVEVYALAAAELVGALYLTPVSPPERQGTVQDGAERHHPRNQRSRSKMGKFGRRPMGLAKRSARR